MISIKNHYSLYKHLYHLVLLFVLVFSIYAFTNDWFFFDEKAEASALSGPIATVPHATYSFSTEVVGASAAHIVVLNSPSSSPDYKWQFLDGAGGIRFMIDRKQGAGWEQLISQIQVSPEYKRQQGPPGNFVWNTYGLNGNTTGGNVLREWDRQDQPDGSVQFVRTSEGFEEGIAETLTEIWTVPTEFEGGSPKATYQMTQNRGIVLDKGVREGAWRMKWALSGISDIVSDNTNITDPDDPSGPWPIRTKTYSNGEFTIDVNDFDNAEATSTPLHTYSEIGTNNKAEIVFYSSGTEGTRIVDPTIVTTALSSPWTFRQGRAIFHNGSRFFILYNDTDTDGNIYYKSSTDGTTWSATSTLVSDQSVFTSEDRRVFAINMVSDTVFDITYITTGSILRTCTINGSSISCDSGSINISNNSGDGSASLGRSSDNYIILIRQRGGVSDDMEINFPISSQSGDAVNIQTDPTAQYAVNSTSLIGDGILYKNSTKALAVSLKDAGGSKNDGYFYGICTSASCSVSNTLFITYADPTSGSFGDLVRVNDNDFRFVLINASGDLEEYKFDGSSWSSLGTIETAGTLSHPTLFRSLISGDLFVFYTDTSATPDVIYRKQKPLGGSWQNKTQVDASESGDRSIALTQRFEIAATSSAQTRDTTYLTWGYRAANGSAYDIAVGNLKLHDLTWATGATDFEIWESGSLTWDAGTLICSGTLTDDNGATVSCDSGNISPSTQYRVQTVLKNTGTSTLQMKGSSGFVDHKNVKSGWAGASPTLGTCGFNDLGGDDGSTTCSVAYNGNDVRVTNTGSANVTIGGGGSEGFMYIITTGADATTDSTGYLNASIGTTTPNNIFITEDSSKITITVAEAGGGITVSGILYSDEGTTQITNGGHIISLAVATGTVGVYSTTTDVGSGVWKIENISNTTFGNGTPFMAWVDEDVNTKGVVITKASSTGVASNITGLNIYQNRVIVRHEATSATSTTITDFSAYTGLDTDIPFAVNGGTLEIFKNNELHIWTGDTFAPGGAVTVHGNASTTPASGNPDGSLHIDDSSTFTSGGNIILAGNWTSDTSSTFTAGSDTVTFNASTTDKTINANSTAFNNLTIDGSSAGVTVSSTDLSVSGTLTIGADDTLTIDTNRTLTTNSTVTINTGGTIDGAGTLVLTSSGLSTTGTLDSRVRFDATGATLTMPARTYGGVVEPYSSGSAGQVTLGSGTHTFSSALQPTADGAGDVTVNGATNNPTINITGNLDFLGTGGGTEIIWTGTGTWTASGNVDFTSGTFTASSSNTFVMNGTAKTLTMGGNTFAGALTLSGSTNLVDGVSVAGNATLSGTVYPQEKAVTLTGTSKTLIGGGTIGALSVAGSYTLSSSDLTVGTTTIPSGGTLTVGSGLAYTSTSTLSLVGTVDGSGTTTIQHSNLTSGGTLNSNVRFDATSGNITTTALTYGANVEYYSNSSASARTVTLGNGTHTISGALLGNAANSQNITLAGNTNNPIVNVTGGVFFIGAGGGSEVINAGSNTWDIDGNLNINGGTFTSTSGNMNLAGNYTNNSGVFTHNSGVLTLNGASQQTLTGSMVDTSAFYGLTITNSSGGGDATNTPSVIFANSASTTNTFTVTTADVTTRMLADALYTFTNINWNGQGAGNPYKPRSSVSGTPWKVDVPGTQIALSYVDFMDTNACTGPALVAYQGTGNVNSGNNTCVAFTGPSISSVANQVFVVGQSATNLSSLTVTDPAGSLITGSNDLRIAIATSTVDMLWDTTDATASFGGTAWGDDVTSATVSYEGGGSVVVITVDNDFEPGDTLVIDGLSFTSFGVANAAISGLDLYIDGPSDIVSDANDDKTIAIKGALVESDHVVGQESNKFTSSSVTGAELFGFKLAPSGESISVTNLVFSLSGIKNITSGDITNAILSVDYNGDGAVDGTDDSVGGAGAVSINGGAGTITFTSSFTATTTRNYIFKADVSSIKAGDEIIVKLISGNITSSGMTSAESITTTGSASQAYHARFGGGQGGGGGAISGVGTSAGVVGGGGSGSGESIGNEPGFKAPSSLGSTFSQWTNPTNAYSSDGSPATESVLGNKQDYAIFGFNIPTGNQIDGIEVKLEASADSPGGTIDVELSWNGGANVTTSGYTATTSLMTTDVVMTVGGPADTWGRGWAPAEFDNGSFEVRVTAQPSANIISLDAIQVKVYHSVTGGGSGGGGEVYAPTKFLANVFNAVNDFYQAITGVFKRIKFDIISKFIKSVPQAMASAVR